MFFELVGVIKVNFEFFMEGINEFVVFVVFDVFLNDWIFRDEFESLFELVKIVLFEIFISCVWSMCNDFKEMKFDVEIVMELWLCEFFEICIFSGIDCKGLLEL